MLTSSLRLFHHCQTVSETLTISVIYLPEHVMLAEIYDVCP